MNNKTNLIEEADRLGIEAFEAWEQGIKLSDYASLRKQINYVKLAPYERAQSLVVHIRNKIDLLIAELENKKESKDILRQPIRVSDCEEL